jgi:RNA polymerase sigma-70 factor (ECF subfamily)
MVYYSFMDEQRPASLPADWVDTHGDALFRYALLQLRDRDAAEDAVQETLLAALRSREHFAGTSSERTWLIGILKHKLADHWRRLGREAPLDLPPDPEQSDALLEKLFNAADDYHWRTAPAPWDDPDDALQDKQFWQVLSDCLAALPPTQAQAFSLSEIDGNDGSETCKVLGVTPTNLWVMLHRARLRLRQCLEQNWFGTEPGGTK